MALEPITRKEKIIAGENLEPITRLEKFLKEYGGSGGSGGGSGGVTTLHINVTAVNFETMEATFTADKTPLEMQEASVTGPIWCVVAFAAGLMAEEAVSIGVPQAWVGPQVVFGAAIARVHDDGGNNNIAYAVEQELSDTWKLNLKAFMS